MIIFGGLGINNKTPSPDNALYVMNLTDFSWYIPNITGIIPSSRFDHRTVLIGKYMVITFGKYNNCHCNYTLFKPTRYIYQLYVNRSRLYTRS